jgi:hypothetical protein
MIKPSHQRLPEQHQSFRKGSRTKTSRSEFKGRARGNTANDSHYTGSSGYDTLGRNLDDDNRTEEDDPRDQSRSASLDDDDRFRSEYYSLDASSLSDTIPESANKDSKNDIAGPDPDSEHVQDSNAIHELLMDSDSDTDENPVDTWSGGIPDGIPQTTTVAPEADDNTESLHFFPSNQQVIVHLIENRNMLPEGALTDDVLDTINTTYALTFHVTDRYYR